jgi:hypothetical protein
MRGSWIRRAFMALEVAHKEEQDDPLIFGFGGAPYDASRPASVEACFRGGSAQPR